VNLIKKIVLAPAAALILLAGTAQANTDEAVLERLKPVGEVCIKGQVCNGAKVEKAAGQADTAQVNEESAAETSAAAVETVAEPAVAASAGRTGEQVATLSCNVCHASGILDAPKTNDTAAWKARADAAGGLEGLLKVSKAGKGAMPPMGTCANCTDEELTSAIKFMSGL